MYILLRQLPYEGYIVSAFTDKGIAKKLYNECIPKIDIVSGEGEYLAIALIEGKVLKELGVGGDLIPSVILPKPRKRIAND